jgi:hypothetical protein
VKRKGIRMIVGCLVLISFAINSFGQTTTATTKAATKKDAKLDKAKVPKVVTDMYFNEYPVTTDENWYGYPAWNDGDYWYDYDPDLFTDGYGNNYVVQFNQNSIPYTVFYSASGKKIATHKTAISDLPTPISLAINKGIYKTWKLGKDKEEIFRDPDLDKLKVYRVKVSLGVKKHTLYFQADGTLLKDKKAS